MTLITAGKKLNNNSTVFPLTKGIIVQHEAFAGDDRIFEFVKVIIYIAIRR